MSITATAAASAEQTPLFTMAFLEQRISIPPTDLAEAAPDVDAYLIHKLRGSLEGACCVHGYIKPGSLKLLGRSMGEAEHGRFTGDFLYVCKVSVLCFRPSADQQVIARIITMNKSGAYALLIEGGHTIQAARVFCPRDLHNGSTEFDAMAVGQDIRVRLLRSRFQVNDPFITVVGTIIF